MVCAKCKKQMLILNNHTYCDCGKKKASKAVLEYTEEKYS
jgi:hypothetical protein